MASGILHNLEGGSFVEDFFPRKKRPLKDGNMNEIESDTPICKGVFRSKQARESC